MKFLVILSILVLCTACLAQDIPVTESSPAVEATQPSVATSEAESASTTTPIATATMLPPTSTPTPMATATLSPPASTPIFELLIDNLAISQQGELYASGFSMPGDNIRHFAQWDGAKWIALGDGFSTAGNTLATDSKAYLYTDVLTEFEHGMATAIMRWDGDKWEDITANFSVAVDALKAGRLSGNIPVLALAVDEQDNLYAAGSYYYPTADNTAEWPMGYVAKWDQDSWTVLGQGFDQVNIYAMVVDAAGNLYVSGEQPSTPEGSNSFVAYWDNETWTPLKTGMLETTQSLALDPSGRLYAYSIWTDITDWDGTDWRSITDQLGGEAPAVFDMAVDRDGELCIAGSFESVNDIPARNIACWDGSSWHALGEGLNERVYALAFDPGGELYAVGYFTEAGGLPADHAARWDGQKWHTLGP